MPAFHLETDAPSLQLLTPSIEWQITGFQNPISWVLHFTKQNSCSSASPPEFSESYKLTTDLSSSRWLITTNLVVQIKLSGSRLQTKLKAEDRL